MTSKIPHSISSEKLLQLHTDKSNECPDCSDKSQIVMSAVDSVYEKLNTMTAFQLTADYSLWVLIKYHKQGYEHFKTVGNVKEAAAWYSDQIRLEDLRNSLSSIHTECSDEE